MQETQLNLKDRHYLRVKGLEKVFQSIGYKKQAGIAISNIYFNLKSIRGDGDGHLILITGTIHQDAVFILNVYAPNTRAITIVKEHN